MSGLGVSTHGRSASQSTSLYDFSSRNGSLAFMSSSSSEADDDDTPLPFPEALPRSDFLAVDFDPETYLSALRERHQTLEDLRTDLRERSAAISTELLELVNSNYSAFLSLGNGLHGGDDKVSDVQMSLFGFRRGLEDLKSQVQAKGNEVAALNDELASVRSDVETGRRMIQADDLLRDLEARLTLGSLPPSTPRTPALIAKKEVVNDEGWFSESEDEDADEENVGMIGTSPAKITALLESLHKVDKLFDQLGRDKPFVVRAEERRLRCRNTIMLDLSNAMREAKRAGSKGQGRLLSYMGIYRKLGASAEATKILKGK
ncbi:hypothetical protein TD95_002120 [Thielaviopsis punctulata]|uniref:Conserved oligomeric Golgi complex subunit 2 n=1 Tax=Thielaviopsis punctulata TaxID=72032 RepID=A0A0F4Z9S8_9PEZI|nr:hypothetical protein TD95_002120 [Thielaviopsis punctulata]